MRDDEGRHNTKHSVTTFAITRSSTSGTAQGTGCIAVSTNMETTFFFVPVNVAVKFKRNDDGSITLHQTKIERKTRMSSDSPCFQLQYTGTRTVQDSFNRVTTRKQACARSLLTKQHQGFEPTEAVSSCQCSALCGGYVGAMFSFCCHGNRRSAHGRSHPVLRWLTPSCLTHAHSAHTWQNKHTGILYFCFCFCFFFNHVATTTFTRTLKTTHGSGPSFVSVRWGKLRTKLEIAFRVCVCGRLWRGSEGCFTLKQKHTRSTNNQHLRAKVTAFYKTVFQRQIFETNLGKISENKFVYSKINVPSCSVCVFFTYRNVADGVNSNSFQCFIGCNWNCV